MKSEIRQPLVAGTVATAAKSVVMLVVTWIGLPHLNPPGIIADFLHTPIFVGWIVHFLIGILFAFAYEYLFYDLLNKVKSKLVRGIIFGCAIFIVSQISFALSGAISGVFPEVEGSILIMLAESLLGHLIFGITIAHMEKMLH